MLLERINNHSLQPESFVGPVNLVIRESCGAYHRALTAAG
jgi:LacI family transcriptional regulator